MPYVIVITCPAKVKSFNVSRGCAARALLQPRALLHHPSVPHKRRQLSWACHNCFIAGHMTSDQPDTNVDFKECNNHLLHT